MRQAIIRSTNLGRFAQADSIVPGGVQGLDRYAYVNNNPLRYTDPTGHMCSDPDNHSKSAGRDGADRVGQVSHGGGLGNSKPDTSIRGGTPSFSKGGHSGESNSSFMPVVPPFNVNIPTLNPIGIYGNDPSFYILPLATKITTQPSFTINNGSPITLGPGRPAGVITERNGNIANRFAINSDRSSSFGVVGFNELNDEVTQSAGVSIPAVLAPDELSVTFTNSTAIDIRHTELNVTINIPVTVSMRYNPATLAGVLAADFAAGVWIAPQFFVPVGKLTLQNAR